MVGIDVNVSTYKSEINSWKIVLHGLNRLLFGRGPATSPYPHAVAFIRSTPDKPRPDIQVQLGPYAFSFSEEGVIPYHQPAISAAINVSHPRSRGSGRLRGVYGLRVAGAFLRTLRFRASSVAEDAGRHGPPGGVLGRQVR